MWWNFIFCFGLVTNWIIGTFCFDSNSLKPNISVTLFHTTDIHGWINGHPHQPVLNADMGDFSNLITHMKIFSGRYFYNFI